VKKLVPFWHVWMVLLYTALLFLSGCCSVEKNAVKQIEATDKIVHSEYIRYIDGDVLLSDEQKDDRRKLIDSRIRLMDALKKSVGE
jgi:hypothetical protein